MRESRQRSPPSGGWDEAAGGEADAKTRAAVRDIEALRASSRAWEEREAEARGQVRAVASELEELRSDYSNLAGDAVQMRKGRDEAREKAVEAVAAEQERRRELATRVLRRMMQAQLAKGFDLFRERCDSAQAHRAGLEVARRVIGRIRHVCISRALDRWAGEARAAAEEREVYAREDALQTALSEREEEIALVKTKAAAFEADLLHVESDNTELMRAKREGEALSVGLVAAAQARRRELASRVIAKLLRQETARAFSGFRDAVDASQVVARMLHAALIRSFESWGAGAVRQRGERELAARLEALEAGNKEAFDAERARAAALEAAHQETLFAMEVARSEELIHEREREAKQEGAHKKALKEEQEKAETLLAAHVVEVETRRARQLDTARCV
ncbi:hypothetical protein T484DRAFT_1910689, partial [Baffinella frigidus]